MGLMRRFSSIFKAKASKTLDKYEDPRETLDYSYERTLEMLQKMRRAVADVATSRKRIELQAQGCLDQREGRGARPGLRRAGDGIERRPAVALARGPPWPGRPRRLPDHPVRPDRGRRARLLVRIAQGLG